MRRSRARKYCKCPAVYHSAGSDCLLTCGYTPVMPRTDIHSTGRARTSLYTAPGIGTARDCPRYLLVGFPEQCASHRHVTVPWPLVEVILDRHELNHVRDVAPRERHRVAHQQDVALREPRVDDHANAILLLAADCGRPGHFCPALTVSREFGLTHSLASQALRAESLNLPHSPSGRRGSAADCPCCALLQPSRSPFRATLWRAQVVRVSQQFSEFALTGCPARPPN